MRRRPSPLAILAYALIAFLYAPLAVVVIFAFNGGANLSWPPQGVSLRWFGRILADADFSKAFATSLRVATVVAILAALIGLTAALVLTRRRNRFVAVIEAFSRLPAMLPPLLIAVALFTTMAQFAIEPSLRTVIVGHIVLVIPFVLVVLTARLQRFDLELEQAARDLGAGPLQTLWRVTLRIIAPAVIGAAMLAFAFSFDEVLVSNFTAGANTTLPLYVFSKLRRSVDPSINAVATLLMVTPWIALAIALPLLRRSLPFRTRREEGEG
jgi:spermidine/putrescine transport system permease protein